MKLSLSITFIFTLIVITKCEKFILNNYQLWSNSVNNFKRFTYINYLFHNVSMEKSGFSYNLTIDNTNNMTEGETFHIYMIKSGVIPHFELINNPAICCSEAGGTICDEAFELNNKNHPNITDENFWNLKAHALYTKDLDLTRVLNISISDRKSFEEEGVFYTLFLHCSPKKLNQTYNINFEDYSKIVKLDGVFSFFNSFGYLSAEEFYTVDIYLFLSLYYFLLGLYWVYKLIIKNSRMNMFSKLLTLAIPIVILEKMMNLQIFSQLNKEGDLDISFEVISAACNILKNVIIRIILFGICLGYEFTKEHSQISYKKIFNFSIFLFCYFCSLVVFSVIYSHYIFYNSSLAYLILSFFFLHLFNVYIIWKIYRGILKQKKFTKFHKNTDLYKFYEQIEKLFFVSAIIVLLTFSLQGAYRFLFENWYVWKNKWLVDILSELTSLIVFSFLTITLLKSDHLENREGYVYQMEVSAGQNVQVKRMQSTESD